MNTEHTQHPCETVDASADVMKLAGMILSDCGCSTAISDRLQRRVAGRIQLYVDNATQQLQGQVGALLAAMDVIALGELPNGKYANISTMMYAEEACNAARRAPIKESLTADPQAEPVAWVRFCSDGCYEGPLMNSSPAMDGARRTSGAWTPLFAAQPVARDVLMEALVSLREAIIDVYHESVGHSSVIEKKMRKIDIAAIADRYAAQPPAVAGAGAVPDERAAFEAWLQENIDDTDTVRPSKEKVDAYFAVWLARAMLAAAPQVATEGCGACGDGCPGQGCRLELESPPTCQKCNGAGVIRGLLSNGGGSYAEPCPDCTAPQATAEDSSVVQDAVAVPVAAQMREALEMMFGSNPSHSVCHHEGADIFGRVKGTWSLAAETACRAALAAAPQAVATGWIDPNDKTQKQFLPHIGEPVLFCCDGVTYYGVHTGGSFETANGFAVKFFETWDCLWMYPPAAAQKGGEA